MKFLRFLSVLALCAATIVIALYVGLLFTLGYLFGVTRMAFGGGTVCGEELDAHLRKLRKLVWPEPKQ